MAENESALNPTIGLRLEIVTLPADRDHGEIARIQTKLTQHCADAHQSTHAEWSQAGVDAVHINALLEAYDKRQALAAKIGPSPGKKVPTPGLRLENDPDELLFSVNNELSAADGLSTEQRRIDIAYINWLIETDEMRREHLANVRARGHDVVVDLGDMTRVALPNVEFDEDYESMAEDYIEGFNHIVVQGIQPIKALFAMSQAFAVCLGAALRANMPFPLAQEMLAQLMKSASAFEKMVRVISKH